MDNERMPEATPKRRRLVRELQPKLIGHFMEVAAHLSISRAARAMNMTQSAMSKSIKQLEDRLGVPLLERLPRGVRLTAYGDILMRRGRLIERELSYAVTEVNTLKGGATGAVRIGAGLVWSQHFLPPIIARFQKSYPAVRVELATGVINTLVPALTGGELDIICVTLDFPDSVEIVKERLVEVRHAIFARRSHPLAAKTHVLPANLQDYGWVALKNDYVGNSRLGAFFAANGLSPPNVRVELPVDLSMAAMLANSDYLGSLPAAMETTVRALGVVPISIKDAGLWSATAGAAYRATSYPTPAVNSFLAMLRESFQR
jgi:DNA-binding transcriptional LysR family regulator